MAKEIEITREQVGPDDNGTIGLNVYVDGSHIGSYIGEGPEKRKIEETARLFANARVMYEKLHDIALVLESGGAIHPGSLIFTEDTAALDVIIGLLKKIQGKEGYEKMLGCELRDGMMS